MNDSDSRAASLLRAVDERLSVVGSLRAVSDELAEAVRESLDCDLVEVLLRSTLHLQLDVVAVAIHPSASGSGRYGQITPQGLVAGCLSAREPRSETAAQGGLPTVLDESEAVTCIPVLAEGSSVGVLYLEHASGLLDEPIIAVMTALARELGLRWTLQQRDRQLRDQLTRLELAEGELRRHADYDPLTRLPSRQRFEDTLNSEWRRACRGDQPLTVMLVRMDRYQDFLGRHGPAAADRAIEAVADAISSVPQRAGDFVARIESETLALVLPTTESIGADTVAGRMRSAVEALAIERKDPGGAAVVTVSIGLVAQVPQIGEAPWPAFEAAEAAVARAAGAGGNAVEIASA